MTEAEDRATKADTALKTTVDTLVSTYDDLVAKYNAAIQQIRDASNGDVTLNKIADDLEATNAEASKALADAAAGSGAPAGGGADAGGAGTTATS